MAAKTTESSTIGSYLMKGTTSGNETTYAQLVRIKSYPDLGGAPNTIEVTDLTDRMQRFVMGVQASDALEFTCNYLPDKYQEIVTLSESELTNGPDKFAIWFGDSAQDTPTGSFGKFSFEGQISVYVNSGDVDAAREMTVTIVPSTKITADVSGS